MPVGKKHRRKTKREQRLDSELHHVGIQSGNGWAGRQAAKREKTAKKRGGTLIHTGTVNLGKPKYTPAESTHKEAAPKSAPLVPAPVIQ